MTTSFSVKSQANPDESVEWGWPDPTVTQWRMSAKASSVQWDDVGPLTEVGAQILLEKFGITALAKDLPLDTLMNVSPKSLMSYRRAYERNQGLPAHAEVISDRCGDHVEARIAA